ncbi:MAG: hemolysin family protein [Planctomycetota bacterium]
MLDPAALALTVALPVLLVFSAFFSGSETALFSLTRHQRKQMARSPTRAANAVGVLVDQTRPLLITLLMGNMTINVLYFVLSSALLLRLEQTGWAGPALAAVSVGSLLGIVLLGEVLPKILANRLAPTWSLVVAQPMLAFHRASTPVRWVAQHGVVSPLARLLAPGAAAAKLDAEDLASMLELSQDRGVIDPGEQVLLDQVLRLGDLRVRQIMTPRVDVHSHDLADPAQDLLELFRATRLRQVPITDGDADKVIGVAYAKQALLRPPTDADAVRRLVRQVRFVPEQMRADRLLVDLRKSGATVAIVVNEYGGTAGLVTLEDVVEQIVGDIPGEFEAVGKPRVETLGPGCWRVDAGLSVREWARQSGAEVPTLDEAGGVDTVGGLVMAALGRAATTGDRARLGNLSLEVAAMDGRRITEVVLTHDAAGEAGP